MSDDASRPPDPGGGFEDIDRRFSEIVARLEDLGPGAGSQEDEQDDAPDPAAAAPLPPPEPTRWREAHPSEQTEEEHFVPLPPPPLPAGDLHFWAILVGLTLGPLLLLLSSIVPVMSAAPWGVLGLVLSVAGFVLLVLRSPRQRHGDDDWGAQV